MKPEIDLVIRLRPAQTAEIEQVRRFRVAADNLRDRVSKGQYTDDDLDIFSNLVSSAGVILHASNPQLAERAGVGPGFFTSVARGQRRPRLQNMVRALEAIIATADERLSDVDKASEYPGKKPDAEALFTGDRYDDLSRLARSLAYMAREEEHRISQERARPCGRI